MNNAVSALLAIVGGVIGLAVIAVLVSPKAQTPQVFSSAGGALSTVISAAVAPVTGTSSGSNSFSTSSLFSGGLIGALDNL